MAQSGFGNGSFGDHRSVGEEVVVCQVEEQLLIHRDDGKKYVLGLFFLKVSFACPV